MKLTPAQCRAARGLLDWTQETLAERASVSRSTIRDYERGRHELHRGTEMQIRIACEAAGVAFVEIEGCGVGVCLKTGETETR